MIRCLCCLYFRCTSYMHCSHDAHDAQKTQRTTPPRARLLPSHLPAHDTWCAGSLSHEDVAALREAFGAAIERIERDSTLSITGQAEPEWATSDQLPEAARAARGRLLLAERRREVRRAAAARRRKLPEQAGPTWTLDRIDQVGGCGVNWPLLAMRAAERPLCEHAACADAAGGAQPLLLCSPAFTPPCTCCRTSCRWTTCTTTIPWAPA